MKEVAGYLPPELKGMFEWKTLVFQRNNVNLEIKTPSLTEDQISDLIEIIKRNSSTVLKAFSLQDIITILDKAIESFLDRNFRYRKKAEELLPIVTGYDSEMIRLGLTSYLKTFRKPQLQRFLVEDLGNPLLLDEFQPRAKGGFSKAVGPELLLHIWAGNVPALPLWSLISGILVKAGNIGKVSSAEPLFAGWFVQALVELEPKLANCFAIIWWKGGDELRERLLTEQADIVVGYGSNKSLEALRNKIPTVTRFLPFGHKISFGIVSKECLDSRKAVQTAYKAAYDVMRYDQQGCYSPHFFYIQRGGKVSPQEFARNIANELECLEKRYPRRKLSIEDISGNSAWLNREELGVLSTPGKEILGSGSNAWTVIYEENPKELTPSCLDRVIKIIAIDNLEEIIPYIKPYRDYLQTVGIAATPKELFSVSDLLGKAGVTRITALGNMTSPEAGWHHDGRFSLLDLVNIVDIEHSAEEYSEIFAPYYD